MLSIRLSALALASLASTAMGQISYTATSIPSIADGSIPAAASLPGGVDVTNGFFLNSFFNPFYSGSGTLSFNPIQTLTELNVRLEASADRGPPGGSGIAQGGADLTLTSAEPTLVRFYVFHRRIQSSQGGTAESSMVIPGAYANPQCPIGSPTCTSVHFAVVDDVGLTIELRADARGIEVGSPSAEGFTFIQFSAQEIPAVGVRYGADCGSTLSAVAVNDSGIEETIILNGPPGAATGFLLLGSNQAATPLPAPLPCELLVDPILASVTLPLDAEGDAELTFALPPPGLFTLQGGTIDAAANLTLTNGLQY